MKAADRRKFLNKVLKRQRQKAAQRQRKKATQAERRARPSTEAGRAAETEAGRAAERARLLAAGLQLADVQEAAQRQAGQPTAETLQEISEALDQKELKAQAFAAMAERLTQEAAAVEEQQRQLAGEQGPRKKQSTLASFFKAKEGSCQPRVDLSKFAGSRGAKHPALLSPKEQEAKELARKRAALLENAEHARRRGREALASQPATVEVVNSEAEGQPATDVDEVAEGQSATELESEPERQPATGEPSAGAGHAEPGQKTEGLLPSVGQLPESGQDADGDLGSVAEGGADDAEAIVAVGEADAARAASPAKAGAADAIVAVGADVSPAKVTGGAGQLVACLSQVAQALVARKPRGRPKGTARPKAGAFFAGGKPRKSDVLAERSSAKRLGFCRSKPVAREKAVAVRAVDLAMQSPDGAAGKQFWREQAAAFNYNASQLKAWCTQKKRKAVEAWSSWREEQNKRERGQWKRFKSQDTGARVGEEGKQKTNTDHFLSYYPVLQQWIREEQIAGKEVSADDVLDQFKDQLAEELEPLDQLEDQGEDKLSAEQVKRLKILRQRQESLLKQDNAKKHRANLLNKTDFRERVPNLTMPMTSEEADLDQLLTLQHFSHIVYKLATADAAELKSWISDPEAWIEDRPNTAWVSSDAVPVYLDTSTGKVLVDLQAIQQLGQRRRRKGESATTFAQRRGAVEKVPLDVQGATRKDKNRLTWICRDVLLGLFSLKPEEIPAGHMLSSVLIVPCDQPCRLKDISLEEPAVWTRDHEVLVKGKLVERKKGEPVGQLMRGWRDHRRKLPELYLDGAVEIYGQHQATMDQSICTLLSDQLRNEELPKLGCRNAIVQTDCAGCEHTPLVKAVKYENQQVDHIIGPKQTQPMQRVDLGHAKRGKDAQRHAASLMRRKQRAKA
mgnify:FL=1